MRQIFNILIEDQPHNRFLAVKRYSLDLFGDMWSLPGRELAPGEQAKDVASKEFVLETGTPLKSLSSTPCLECQFPLFSHPVNISTYSGQLSASEFHPADPDISRVTWIYPSELLASLESYGYPPLEIDKFKKLLLDHYFSL